MANIEIYEQIIRLNRSGEAAVLVTVVDRSGSAPQDPGAKLLVTSQGNVFGTVGGGALESEAIETAKELLQKKTSGLQKYSLGKRGSPVDEVELGMMCGGSATLFYEYLGKSDCIFIFGAGHVGKALLHHLKDSGSVVTVIDSREEMLKGVEGAVTLHVEDYGEIEKKVTVSDGSYLIVATHSHDSDFDVLKCIYSSPWRPCYVGALASKKKAQAMIQKLKEEIGEGVDLQNLYMPVGLDLGGRSVDEIAVSIIAEIQSLKYKKTGLHHMKAERKNNDRSHR
jgi:xanthine dehydrogenase accessory factor